jgi:hypothetical protein
VFWPGGHRWHPRPFSGCCRALQPLPPGPRPCVPRDEREPDPGGPCPCGTAGLPRAPPGGGLLPHLPAPLGADRLHGHRIHGFLLGRWAVRALWRAGHLAGHPHDEPGPARWTTARTDLPRPRAPGPGAADHEADLAGDAADKVLRPPEQTDIGRSPLDVISLQPSRHRSSELEENRGCYLTAPLILGIHQRALQFP